MSNNNNNSGLHSNKKEHKNKNNNNNTNNNNNNVSVNEELLQFNQRKLKSVSDEEKIKSMKCSSVSEAVAKFIIEKLISLTISTSYNNEIDNKLSDFCFKKLKQTLDTYTELNFLAYDRDDVPNFIEKEIIHSKSQNNSQIKITSNLNENFINDNNNNNNNDNKNNCTEILSNRKLLNESESKNKEIEKEKEKKEDESFLNYFQKQESIKNFGSNLENIEKIENIDDNYIESNNILNPKKKIKFFYDAAFIGENDWNIVPQPIPVKVDRNASTMIKYDIFNTNLSGIREDKNDDKTVIISNSMNNNNLRSSLILNNNNNKPKHKRNISKKSNEDNKKKKTSRSN